MVSSWDLRFASSLSLNLEASSKSSSSMELGGEGLHDHGDKRASRGFHSNLRKVASTREQSGTAMSL